MPIYEYKCQSCHRTLEFIQKFSDPLLTECPDCSGKLEKIVSSPHFELKGTGWYVTDFKNSDKKPQESTKIPENEATKAVPSTSDQPKEKNVKTTPPASATSAASIEK